MTTNKYTKRFATFAVVLALVLSLLTVAYADFGPKPSVRVNFENMGEELCYGTLLSARESTGPSSAWDGDPDHARHNGVEGYGSYGLEEEIWHAFVGYEDKDGYYFLQEGWVVSAEKELAWTYYPPNPFKILLYFPETGEFMTSGIYERYAFDSYFTVDMAEVDDNGLLLAEKSYRYGPEIASFFARFLLTFAVEMGIALLFGFREKKQLLLLLWVNGATQLILNVLLNIISYRSGMLAFVLSYILFELIVFAIEAVVYSVWMRRVSEKPKKVWVCVVYALVANAVSFVVGYNLALVIPSLF